MNKMTKEQLVKAINNYPGPEVTTRARKATLDEILMERIEDALDVSSPGTERTWVSTVIFFGILLGSVALL